MIAISTRKINTALRGHAVLVLAFIFFVPAGYAQNQGYMNGYATYMQLEQLRNTPGTSAAALFRPCRKC